MKNDAKRFSVKGARELLNAYPHRKFLLASVSTAVWNQNFGPSNSKTDMYESYMETVGTVNSRLLLELLLRPNPTKAKGFSVVPPLYAFCLTPKEL